MIECVAGETWQTHDIKRNRSNSGTWRNSPERGLVYNRVNWTLLNPAWRARSDTGPVVSSLLLGLPNWSAASAFWPGLLRSSRTPPSFHLALCHIDPLMHTTSHQSAPSLWYLPGLLTAYKITCSPHWNCFSVDLWLNPWTSLDFISIVTKQRQNSDYLLGGQIVIRQVKTLW